MLRVDSDVRVSCGVRFGTPEGPRVTIGGRPYDWFRGNSYLGLQSHAEVIAAACEATRQFGLKLRDHRDVGCHPCLLEWEAAANAFFGCDEALLLASGYAGAMVMAAALADAFEVAFVDEQSHPNVWDGLASSGKPAFPFRHRCPDALASALAARLRAGQRPLVVSDGVFPITGALAPVLEYQEVLEPYEGWLLCLDDAHGVGVLGNNGRGTLEHFGATGSRLFAYGTMSKAFGAHGGVIPASTDLRARIEDRSAAYRSTTKAPPGVVAAGARALEIARREPGLRARLASHVARVRSTLRATGFVLEDSPAPVVCLAPQADVEWAAVASRLFQQDDIAVAHMASGYPNLPAGGCLVFSLSAGHDDEQLDHLLDALQRAV